MKFVFALLSVMLLIVVGCTQQAPPKACTQEAKLCPDGSSVGRTGPNCEFAPCPQVVGNDTDAHGCKGSAGYSWCEILKKCVREFETPCATPQYTVKTANSSLGEILVDGRGYTLYTFSTDTPTNSTCYGTCATNWPPLLVDDTIAIPSGTPGKFGAILRTDGGTQVTYNGWPLYYYAGDNQPGDTNGDKATGKWFVVHPGD